MASSTQYWEQSDEEIPEELMTMFFESLAKRSAALQDAICFSQWRTAARIAHMIAGSCAVYGFAVVAGIAQDIETLCSGPHTDATNITNLLRLIRQTLPVRAIGPEQCGSYIEQ